MTVQILNEKEKTEGKCKTSKDRIMSKIFSIRNELVTQLPWKVPEEHSLADQGY